MRTAKVIRKTLETDIIVEVNLDGEGQSEIQTGIGFFDHMLASFSRHSLIDIKLSCKGDIHVDGHHTVEDTGLALGEAVRQALGDKAGIARMSEARVPMDEALASVALDISGRPFLKFISDGDGGMIGGYDVQLTKEFMRGFSSACGITLHMSVEGENAHHMAEAAYKALARALRAACALDPRVKGVPSTKGAL